MAKSKIKYNYLLLEDLPSSRRYKHLSPLAFTIIALTFFPSIPTPIFWALILIYLAYCLVPINPDLSHNPDESQFHPSFGPENPTPEPTGLSALLGQSDGLKKLQMWARFFLPRDKSQKAQKTPEITTVRPSLRHSMSFDNAHSLFTRLGSTRLKWPSFINGRRSRAVGRQTSLSPSLTSSVPDINANYLRQQQPQYEEEYEVSGSYQMCAEDADLILINGNGSDSSESSLVLVDQDSLPSPPIIAPTLTRSLSVSGKKAKKQPYSHVVNVVLVRGKHIALTSDWYLKLRLGKAKCKSRVVSSAVSFPYWGEEFTFHLYPPPESQTLEIFLCEYGQPSEQYLERTAISLDRLATEQVHRLEEKFTADLADRRTVELQITLTGGYPTRVEGPSTPLGYSAQYSDSSSVDSGFWERLNAQVKIDSHPLVKGIANLYDIGSLKVKVIEAEALGDSHSSSQPKLNPFCIVELMNDKYRTQTIYRTTEPRWAKTFEFAPKDILHYLELSIYTEESKEKSKFLGKAVVPLLEIEDGSRHWYQLKDQKFRSDVPGRLHLEFAFSYNWFKCGARSIFTKKETRLVPRPARFQKAHFMRNALRIKQLANLVGDWWSFWNTIVRWQYPLRSTIGLVYSFAFLYYFEWYHVPLAWLLYMLKNAALIRFRDYERQLTQQMATIGEMENEVPIEVDAESEESADSLSDLVEQPESESAPAEPAGESATLQTRTEEDKEETLKEKLQSVQEVGGYLLEVVLTHSSIFDKLVTLSHFGVPFQSWVMVAVLIIIVGVGFRYFFIILLLNEFMKHLRGHNVVGNNEAFNVILRAPEIEELPLYRGCRINNMND